MISWPLLILSFLLITAGLWCVWLMIQFSRKLKGVRGELPEEIENLDKTRSELIEMNMRLKKELEECQRRLKQKGDAHS